MTLNTIPEPSDSLLFFQLGKRVGEAQAIWNEIDDGKFGEDKNLDEIKEILDVPSLQTMLMGAIDEVDQSLALAGQLADRYKIPELRQRIRQIESVADQLDPRRQQP